MSVPRLFLCESCLPRDKAPEPIPYLPGTRNCNGCQQDVSSETCHLYDAQEVALKAIRPEAVSA